MNKSLFTKIMLHGFVIIMIALSVYPIFIMFFGSFKTAAELASNPGGIPQSPTFDNYVRLYTFQACIMLRTFFNAIFIAVLHTCIAVFISAMAGYAFAKYTFIGKTFIFLLFLATMMIPRELLIPPLYISFAKIHWLNTYRVQIFPFIANVFAMFLLKQYMESIPTAIIDAGRVDGAGEWSIFGRLVLPMAMPAIGVLWILIFMEKWNDYLWPLMMVKSKELLPIMVILPTLNDEASVWSVPWELVLAGCTIVTLPIMIAFFMFQDKFMSSVTIGAVKE